LRGRFEGVRIAEGEKVPVEDEGRFAEVDGLEVY